MQLERMELYGELRSGRLDLLQFLDNAGIGRVPQDRQPGECGEDLLQELQSLGCQLGCEKAGPCDVSSRTCKASNEASRNRITDGRHNDGDRLGRLPCGVGGLPSGSHDNVNVSLSEVVSERW